MPLGIGVPFMLAALFTGPFLRAAEAPARHLGRIEKAMGTLLVATGALIFTGYMPVLAGWLLEAAPIFGRIG
jgi:cytochrome c-type biogenesis protein